MALTIIQEIDHVKRGLDRNNQQLAGTSSSLSQSEVMSGMMPL
jgi:hypothetical protein